MQEKSGVPCMPNQKSCKLLRKITFPSHCLLHTTIHTVLQIMKPVKTKISSSHRIFHVPSSLHCLLLHFPFLLQSNTQKKHLKLFSMQSQWHVLILRFFISLHRWGQEQEEEVVHFRNWLLQDSDICIKKRCSGKQWLSLTSHCDILKNTMEKMWLLLLFCLGFASCL